MSRACGFAAAVDFWDVREVWELVRIFVWFV
jgi:hypothetical protein